MFWLYASGNLDLCLRYCMWCHNCYEYLMNCYAQRYCTSIDVIIIIVLLQRFVFWLELCDNEISSYHDIRYFNDSECYHDSDSKIWVLSICSSETKYSLLELSTEKTYSSLSKLFSSSPSLHAWLWVYWGKTMLNPHACNQISTAITIVIVTLMKMIVALSLLLPSHNFVLN